MANKTEVETRVFLIIYFMLYRSEDGDPVFLYSVQYADKCSQRKQKHNTFAVYGIKHGISKGYFKSTTHAYI